MCSSTACCGMRQAANLRGPEEPVEPSRPEATGEPARPEGTTEPRSRHRGRLQHTRAATAQTGGYTTHARRPQHTYLVACRAAGC